MNPSMSSLNPNAAAYIPLNKREEEANNQTALFSSPSQGHSGTEQHYLQGEASSDFSIHEIGALLIDNGLGKSDSQITSDQAEVQYMDEDSEIDVAYLTIMFPNISEQFLADVYSANDGDLEAAIYMVTELECCPVVASKSVSVCLDTGDASE